MCNYRMGQQRHDAFDSFFFHVIFYTILHFKINIIIPNLFACQKTIPRPSFKTKTLGIKTKNKTFKIWSRDVLRPRHQDQDQDLRHQDQEQDFQDMVSRRLETKTQVSRTPCLANGWRICGITVAVADNEWDASERWHPRHWRLHSSRLRRSIVDTSKLVFLHIYHSPNKTGCLCWQYAWQIDVVLVVLWRQNVLRVIYCNVDMVSSLQQFLCELQFKSLA